MTTKYLQERKEASINEMLPPSNICVSELAKQDYIDKTMQTQKSKADNTSVATKQWIAEQKLTTIIEISTLNEQVRHEYCRINGLYSADIES